MTAQYRFACCHVVILSLLCITPAFAQEKAPQRKASKDKPAKAQTSPDKVSPDLPRYKNPSLSIDDRIADLLPRMTIEEKVDQIKGGGRREAEVLDPTGTYTTESARAILNRWGDPDLVFKPRDAAILRNGIQRYLREKTRLGIPSLQMGEALHGFMEYDSTSFPQALGLASTRHP